MVEGSDANTASAAAAVKTAMASTIGLRRCSRVMSSRMATCPAPVNAKPSRNMGNARSCDSAPNEAYTRDADAQVKRTMNADVALAASGDMPMCSSSGPWRFTAQAEYHADICYGDIRFAGSRLEKDIRGIPFLFTFALLPPFVFLCVYPMA